MSRTSPEPPRWSPRKWGTVIGELFLLHVALILAFAQRERAHARPAPSGPQIHMVTAPLSARRIAASFFASDPTLFSSLSRHGFSGPAWLEFSPSSYAFPNSESPPRWLEVNPHELGLLAATPGNGLPAVLEPAPLGEPLIEPPSFVRQKEPERPKSTARLTGDLAARRVELPRELPSWPPLADSGAILVSNTVVELAADGLGEVVSARLRSKCGLDAADAEALRTAWHLHFSPQSPGWTNAPAMTWGHLIIEWQTVPETNVPPKTP